MKTASFSRHLVDPELLPALDFSPNLAFTAENLTQIRDVYGQLLAALPVPPENGVTVVERMIPGSAGAPDVRVLIYTPPNAAYTLPVMLDIHGGGFVIGNPEMVHGRNYWLSAELNCVIVSVDYRLPPEHPHPAPIEDCYTVLLWMRENAPSLGVDAKKIAICGVSAGGGLAASLALLARDRNEVAIAFLCLMCPMLDDRTALRDVSSVFGEFTWRRGDNYFGWESLLGEAPGSAGVSPYASAARAETVAGLPPTFIGVGALDLFVDEDIAYAQRLLQAGVPTELHVYPGGYHGFDVFAPGARVSRQFQTDAVTALRNAWEK